MTNDSLSRLSAAQLQRASGLKERIEKLEKELGSILGSSEATVAKPVGRKKRKKMSAAARARIGAATKARWARVRAAKKS